MAMVPKQRLRRKTSEHEVSWRCVARGGQKVQQAESKKRYRVMYYCTHHSIALRQCFGHNSQIGSARLPNAMLKDDGIALGVKARETLERHPRQEAHTSFLLRMAVESCALDDRKP
eukprot:2010792-Amphidinium_carterae.1